MNPWCVFKNVATRESEQSLAQHVIVLDQHRYQVMRWTSRVGKKKEATANVETPTKPMIDRCMLLGKQLAQLSGAFQPFLNIAFQVVMRDDGVWLTELCMNCVKFSYH